VGCNSSGNSWSAPPVLRGRRRGPGPQAGLHGHGAGRWAGPGPGDRLVEEDGDEPEEDEVEVTRNDLTNLDEEDTNILDNSFIDTVADNDDEFDSLFEEL